MYNNLGQGLLFFLFPNIPDYKFFQRVGRSSICFYVCLARRGDQSKWHQLPHLPPKGPEFLGMDIDGCSPEREVLLMKGSQFVLAVPGLLLKVFLVCSVGKLWDFHRATMPSKLQPKCLLWKSRKSTPLEDWSPEPNTSSFLLGWHFLSRISRWWCLLTFLKSGSEPRARSKFLYNDRETHEISMNVNVTWTVWRWQVLWKKAKHKSVCGRSHVLGEGGAGCNSK